MKIKYVVIVLFFYFNNCYSQQGMTYWGGCYNEIFFDIATIKNDIYVVGETTSFDSIYRLNGYGDVLIFKNQGLYNNSWVKTLRGSIKLDRGIDIEIINDSTVLLTGVYSKNDGYNAADGPFGTFISKINSNGKIIWSKFFELDNYFPRKAIATKSNEFILLKFSTQVEHETCNSSFYHTPTIIKIDDEGNILQSKLFSVSHIPPSDYWGEVFDIIPAKDSGYILVGRTNLPYYPYILKIDENLNPVWLKVYKYDNMFENFNYGNSNNVLMLNDGYIILGQNYGRGTSFTGPCLFKTDFDGNLKWFKEYRDTSIVKNLFQHGNYLYFTSTEYDRNWHITCLNLNGEIIWSKKLEDEFDLYYREKEGKLISFQDTLYFIASSSKNELMNSISPFGKQWDIEFLKLDTSQQYFSNLKNNEIQVTNINLDTFHCNLYYCEFPVSTVTAAFREKNVSFDYDSIQCNNLYLISAINEKTLDNSNNLFIYPNPCKDYFYINGNIEIIKQGTLHIYDISGNLCISKYFDNFSTPIILGKLNKGIYFVKIEVNNKNFNSKIIIE